MEKIRSLSEAKKDVLLEVKRCVGMIRSLVRQEITSVHQGIEMLMRLRKEVYEDLNQIAHEEMILRAARLLEQDELEGHVAEWYWNPKQTGDLLEPDLRGVRDEEVVVSAEITTSERPVGTIDSRMRHTLEKLNAMRGRKYYFVRTPKMEQRARTKVKKNGYIIEVRRI